MFRKIYILMMLGMLFVMASCREDDLLVEEPFMPEEQFKDVYSLGLMVTLDNMGSGIEGTRGVTTNDPSSITKWENYINLERFRILFFDENDNFLFESKNRWVKQIDVNDNFSSWYVNVPFGAFGNDSYGEGHEYNWTSIRNHLTSKRFKIAILANRPAQLLYPGNFADSELQLPNGVFDNDGPYWGPDDVGKKNVFDLHHYQYDIIYADKGNHKNGATESYYDFVMGNNNTDRPTMGSAINWVSFDNDDNDKVLLGGSTNMRHLKMPSADHPIPMYGMQIFDPIPADQWQEGTPFDLSNEPSDMYPDKRYNYTSISLLRSCVRLDLKIPKSLKNGAKPRLVSLWYSNIYSRTEPMDTWTPTDQIWKGDHLNACEWKDILQYGPISSNTYPGNGSDKVAYQTRISWLYGVWKEKGWPFRTRDNKAVNVPAEASGMKYPRIFNPCIQRNKAITCERGDKSNDYNDGYWHYIVYTGERNSNDPNTLPNMTKNPYIACFIISWDNAKYYCIPLLNYAQNTDADAKNIFGPHTDRVGGGDWPAAMDTYINTLPSERGVNLPYPLLRNHIYRFTLTGTRAGDDLEDFGVSSEVLQSPTINFSNQVKEFKLQKLTNPNLKK